MHRQYTTYIKQNAIITISWYLATCFGRDRPSSGQQSKKKLACRWPDTAETCSQISPNCNYCILFDVCCVLTVHNVLYRFYNTQRNGLSQMYCLPFSYRMYKLYHRSPICTMLHHLYLLCTSLHTAAFQTTVCTSDISSLVLVYYSTVTMNFNQKLYGF